MNILLFLIIALVAALLVYAMLFLAPTPKNKPKRGVRGHIDKEEIKGRWNTILLTSETGASGMKSAINEADKLLDHVMKLSGFGGDTMADRLRQAERRLSHKNDVWRAHKLRNSLAHDVGFDLVQSQAKEALRDFERALKDLGAI